MDFNEFVLYWMPPRLYPDAVWHLSTAERLTYIKPFIAFRLKQYMKSEGKNFDWDSLKRKVCKNHTTDAAEFNQALKEIKQWVSTL